MQCVVSERQIVMSTENKPTKQEIASTLLSEYKAADNEVTRIKHLLDEANKKRSDVVKKLHDQLGRGPFIYRGEYLGKIVIRGQTYFMRGAREESGIKID